MKAAVLGATGFIGSHVCEQLLLAGHSVTAVVRPTSDTSLLKRIGANICITDFRTDAAIIDAIRGHDTVCNCMASVRLHLPIASHRAVDVHLTQQIVKAAAQAGIKRLVQLSTVQVYGFQRPPIPIDEEYPCHASYAFNLVAQEREAAVRQAAENTEMELVIARPVNTFGRRDRTLAEIVNVHSKGFFVVFGNARNRFSCIDTRDLGRAMVLLAEAEQLTHTTYLISGCDTTWREVRAALDRHTGRQSRLVCIPAGAGKAIAGMLEKITPFCCHLQITPFAVSVMSSQTLFDDQRIRQLGFAPRYDIFSTIGDFLESD